MDIANTVCCYQRHPSERILEYRRSRLQNVLINRHTSQLAPKSNSSPSSSILIMGPREREERGFGDSEIHLASPSSWGRSLPVMMVLSI